MQTFQWTCANCGRKALPTQPVFEYGRLLVCAHCYRALMPTYRRIVFDLVALTRHRRYRIVAGIAIGIAALAGLDLALTHREPKTDLPQAQAPPSLESPTRHTPTEKEIREVVASMSDEDRNALMLAFLDNDEDASRLTTEKVDAYRPLLRSLAARYDHDVNDIKGATAKLKEMLAGEGIDESCLRLMSAVLSYRSKAKLSLEVLYAAYFEARKTGRGHEATVLILGQAVQELKD
jgi:hypothetical protein